LFAFTLQKIDAIPDHIKQLYKTVWEIPQRLIIKMAADRGPYIDQSQSLNIHFAEPDKKKLDSAHFYAWKSVGCFHLCVHE
jgi:ribonucleoside-diphosphate reductase subunit M1